MTVSPPKAAPTTRALAARSELSNKAKHLLRNGMSPDAFAIALSKAALPRDALSFLAGWLDKRQTVWWGCQCLWLVFGHKSTPALQAVFQLIVRWVLDPSETTRRPCAAAADWLTAAHPVGALALAVFASEGSLSQPGLPEVPAPATLTASAVVGALLAAGSMPDAQQGYHSFVMLGIDVAQGRNLWS